MTGKRGRKEDGEEGDVSKKKIAIPNSAKHSLQGLLISLFSNVLCTFCFIYLVVCQVMCHVSWLLFFFVVSIQILSASDPYVLFQHTKPRVTSMELWTTGRKLR